MKMEEEWYKLGAGKMIALVWGTIMAAVVTFLLLGIFAFVMLKMEISIGVENIGVICISVLSCLAGGFICGKKNVTRGFLWGLAVGLLYFCLLLLLRLSGGQENSEQGIQLFTTFLYCVGSGMLGGMLS